MKKYFIGNNLLNYDNIENATIKDLLSYLVTQKVIGLDIETSRKYPKNKYKENIYKPGLDPYLSNIVMIQLGTLERVYAIDVRAFNKDHLLPLLNFLNYNDNILLVGHNLKFEGKFLYQKYGIHLKNVYDTMLVEINLTNGLNLRYGLADLAERYLNAIKVENINLFNLNKYNKIEDINETIFEQEEQEIIDKSTRLGFINIGDKPFTQQQLEYGVDDIINPLKIRLLQLQSDYNPFVCNKLENKFSQVLAKMEVDGMNFDSLTWLKIYEEKKVIYHKYLQKLNKYVVSHFPKFVGMSDLFNSESNCTIQWTSSKQVIELFKHLGICPKEKSKQTKKLEYTVGEKAMFKLLNSEFKAYYYSKKEIEITDNQSLILNYLQFKKYEQSVTTFGKDWLKYVHPITGKVHSNYKQIMSTGRLSSSNPNLQNIPSDKAYRKCFIAPKGYKVINADYSAQEIRVLAEVSGVKEMQDFFLHGDEVYGEDFHSWVANKSFKIIYNNPEFVVPPKELKDGSKNPEFKHDKERNTSKAISFKVSYGGSAYTMKDDFGVSEEEAEKFIEGWFAPFKGLKENFETTKINAVKNGFVDIDSFTGRKWFFKEYKEMIEAQEKALSIYPKDYKTYSEEEKLIWKENNKHLTSSYWKKYFTLKSSLERKGLNFRIQGLAGGMTKLACILIYDFLISNKIDYAYLNNVIHDETNSYCIDDPVKYQYIAENIERCMIEAGKYFCKNVPMNAHAVVGDYWSH